MNSRLENAIQRIFDLASKQGLPPDVRINLLRAARDIMQGQSEYEDQLRELRELLYRNPAFPDDLGGFWDDDLPEDDDEDES
jgi:hypothetical protein